MDSYFIPRASSVRYEEHFPFMDEKKWVSKNSVTFLRSFIYYAATTIWYVVHSSVVYRTVVVVSPTVADNIVTITTTQ